MESPHKKSRHHSNPHSHPSTTTVPSHAWLSSFLSFAPNIDGLDMEDLGPFISWLLGPGSLDSNSPLDALFQEVVNLVSSEIFTLISLILIEYGQDVKQHHTWNMLCLRVVRLASEDEKFHSWFQCTHPHAEKWQGFLVTTLIIGKIYRFST